MAENKLISIIVPVYNVENYLDRCLNSIVSQTYQQIEIIIVNDGSTDSSEEIINFYKSNYNNIKVIHQKNEGLSSARNRGICEAKGEYIGFVDSDDWIHPQMYEKMLDLAVKEDADLVMCSFKRMDKVEETNSKQLTIKEYSQEEFIKVFFKINSQRTVYYAWNKLYKRSLIDKDMFPKGLICEDVVGTFKAISRAQKIIETNQIYYYYYYNPNSITGKLTPKIFDNIKVWDIVLLMSQNKYYEKFAYLNRCRIDFTVVLQLFTYESYNEIITSYKKEVNECLSRLASNKKYLLNSDISFSRKLAIILLLLNPKIFSVFFRQYYCIVKKWRKW